MNFTEMKDQYFNIYPSIIAQLSTVEEKRKQIYDEELSLKCKVDEMNKEETKLGQLIESLSTKKKELESDLSRLKLQNDKIVGQLTGLLEMQFEMTEINLLNSSIRNLVESFTEKLNSGLDRIHGIKLNTNRRSVAVETDISGQMDDGGPVHGQIQAVISNKLELVEAEIIKVCEEKKLVPKAMFDQLCEEEKELKRKIRDMKKKLAIEPEPEPKPKLKPRKQRALFLPHSPNSSSNPKRRRPIIYLNF